MSEATQNPVGDRPTAWRTHTCGELREAHLGAKVTLCGHVKHLVESRIWDLRDGNGVTRVTVPSGVVDEELKSRQMQAPSLETVVKVKGEVRRRASPDPTNPTGLIHLHATEVEFVSFAASNLVFDPSADDVPADERIRHRYLALRNLQMHERMRARTKFVQALRVALGERHFEDVETPLLADKWTPEQTEAYLAIRDNGKVFALPGQRSIHGALLMAAGFDRVFEVARRFRKKAAYTEWQQPEFNVLDASLAYAGEEDLHLVVDSVLTETLSRATGVEQRPPLELTYDDAWLKYGTGAPDLRVTLEIQDATPLAAHARALGLRELRFNGGAVRALRVPSSAERLANFALRPLLEGSPGVALHKLTLGGDGKPAETTLAVGVTQDAPLDGLLAAALVHDLKVGISDTLFVAVANPAIRAAALLGKVRMAVAKELKLETRKHALVRITRLPYVEQDPVTLETRERAEPLARAAGGDELPAGPKGELRAQAFHLVYDGVNVGGGSVRNHDQHAQGRLFEQLHISSKDVDQRYGRLQAALRFGVPPHARFALGIDRLVALTLGLPAIHEVMPLPKMADGMDPLTRSPWPIDNNIVRALLGL